MAIIAPWGNSMYADELKTSIPPIVSRIQSETSALPTIQNNNIGSIQDHIKQLYSSGHQEEAINEAKNHLNKYPTDSDIRLLLGQLFFSSKDYEDARQELLAVLQQIPDYSDASLVLINVDMILANYQEALNIANSSLLLDPTNPELIRKKAGIITIISSKQLPILSTNQQDSSMKKSTVDSKLNTIAKETVPEYKILNDLYVSGLHTEAVTQAITYLNEHPSDVDVRLVLGKFYFYNKDYSKAREELTTVLQTKPSYTDARILLISVEMASVNYAKALSIAKAGLLLSPQNNDLTIKVKSIAATINENKPPLKKTLEITTVDTHKTDKAEPKKYKNEIGLIQQQYYLSDVKKVWDYSTLYYGRETPIGKIYGKINYDYRFGQRAIQGEIEAYPKINKYIYLDLDVAYANQPNLFPDQTYGAEAYVSMKKTFDFSVGGKYNIIDARHNFTTYTGTLSKAIKSNRITFRPYYFVPGVGKPSTLYTINLRHIMRDPYYYFGCILGTGTSPDLASLTTVGFIVVHNNLVNPYINFPLFNDRLIVNLNLLYLNQIFPRNKVRDWSGGTVGLAWKF